MKTTEIQIGDWLEYKGQFNRFTFTVEQVTKKRVGYHAEPFENRMHYLRLPEIQPIPLTDKILSHNFEKIEYSYPKATCSYQLCDLWRIWSNPNYGYIAATLVIDDFGGGSYEPCVPIRYVHELQHLLRLLYAQKEEKPKEIVL